MYFVRYDPLKEKLKQRNVSDQDALPYLILFSMLTVASSAFPIAFPITEKTNIWGVASAVSSVLLAGAGVYYSYIQNGKEKGFDLVQKYVVLGWVVTIRCVLAFLPLIIIAYIAGEILELIEDAFSWYDFFITIVFELVLYQRIGRHIRDTRNAEIETLAMSNNSGTNPHHLSRVKNNNFLGAFVGSFAGVLVCSALFCGICYYVYETQFDLENQLESMSESLQPPNFQKSTKVAEYEWKLLDLNAQEVSFDSFRNEVILLNIWATWCPPCVAEMPTLQNLYDKIGNEVKIVCASSEEIDTIKNFVNDNKYTFPIYKVEGELPAVFESDGIPATFVINKVGEIVFSKVGGADWGHEDVVKFLTSYL